MTEPKKSSVEDCVSEQLEEWSKGCDAEKIFQVKEAPDQFEPREKALFHSLFRRDISVPCIPGLVPKQPSLLMYDLGKDKEAHKAATSYKYIAETKEKGPGALYGTSGAGKTRSVLEYLSYNKGLYLAASPEDSLSQLEPGSGDLMKVFMRKQLTALQARRSEKEKLDQSLINLDIVKERVSALLYIRHAVYKFVVEKLGGEISALEWLMLQLYPTYYFGTDIFVFLLSHCIMNADLKETCDAAFSQATTKWEAIVIDESQILLRDYSRFFCSSKDSKKARSGFAALFSSLLALKKDSLQYSRASIPYPLFAGTGMSIAEVDDEAISAIAKRTDVIKRSHFTRFSTLNVEGVKSYMKKFLILDSDVGDAVLDHIAKWLSGRPRWTATFLEEFFVRGSRPKHLTTNAIFMDNEKILVQALDRYIHDLTKPDRRLSWTGSNDTAYTAIHRAMERGKRDMANDVEHALFHFTFGGNPHIIKNSSKDLIEIGVARLKVEGTGDDDGNILDVTIDEPLMVEAGINYVGLQRLANIAFTLRRHSGGVGDSFEEIAVVALRKKLKDLLGETFSDSNELANLHAPTKSSYGVMAKSCKGQSSEKIIGLLDWIDSATSATFEGTVPPFCFPTEMLGPDVVCLLRDDGYRNIGTVLCQAKFSSVQSQPEALRTVVPEWLFYENRDKEERGINKKFGGEELQRWNNLKSKLVGDDIPLVRCLIEYPVNATRSSQSGRIHRNSIEPCADSKICNEKLDWLLTIAGQNADTFFDREVLSMLNLIKGKPKDKKRKKPG